MLSAAVTVSCFPGGGGGAEVWEGLGIVTVGVELAPVCYCIACWPEEVLSCTLLPPTTPPSQPASPHPGFPQGRESLPLRIHSSEEVKSCEVKVHC